MAKHFNASDDLAVAVAHAVDLTAAQREAIQAALTLADTITSAGRRYADDAYAQRSGVLAWAIGHWRDALHRYGVASATVDLSGWDRVTV